MLILYEVTIVLKQVRMVHTSVYFWRGLILILELSHASSVASMHFGKHGYNMCFLSTLLGSSLLA